MLQQTQVATVIPYFERFLRQFPTVDRLAATELPEVLAMWKGLGYYSRARNLHRAAKVIVDEHGGKVPDQLPHLLRLPGFGRYTAGAVASIAFGRPAPIVDGNVARVLTRVHAIDLPHGDRRRDEVLWATAEALVQGKEPGTLNEALMELGALICTPAPQCARCPVSSYCAALKLGVTDELPRPKPRARRVSLKLSIAVCSREGKVLFGRRAETGLFGGLWELPAAETPEQLSDRMGSKLGRKMKVVERVLTHRDLQLTPYLVSASPNIEKKLQASAIPPAYLECRWVTQQQAESLAVSAAMQEVLKLARHELAQKWR